MASPQPQPQPPPQPIYPYDLNLALDRVHNRFVEYADARDGALASQMRVGFAEAYQRDEVLLKRIENLETTVKTVIDLQREMMSSMQAMHQSILQEMHTGFSALNEKINELTTRVVKLEGGLPPTITES
jgi:chromosome segregation ATPase